MHSTNNSGLSESLWMEAILPPCRSLEQNGNADICIVGAGIAGLTCAYILAKRGYSVIVLDQGAIGGGQSARTTAHITWVLDDRFFKIERLFGIAGAQQAAKSHFEAINTIEKIVGSEGIKCDFERVDGYLFAPPGDIKTLEKEWKALQNIGFPTPWVDKAPFSTFNTGRCLHFPGQAQFHILKYLRGLIAKIIEKGGAIYDYTPATKIKDGNPVTIETPRGVVTAKNVIVATCTPVNDRFHMHTKQAAYRTYVIGALVPRGSIPIALYWDTLDPYHYIRLYNADRKNDWLIIGGEDHKTGQEKAINKKYNILEKWARKHFPFIREITYKWSGQVFEPVDSLAFIGQNPGDQNIWIATGDSGNGITHGTIAGLLLPDLIEKIDHPWKKIYSPSRITFSAAKEFIKENCNTLLQYKDWLTPGEIKEVKKLSPGFGKILRDGLKKLAVYKDEFGAVHIRSAMCPHLGACVRWNDSEKSWDCPAHGSRFDGCGNFLNGPALKPLNDYDSYEAYIKSSSSKKSAR